MTDHEATQSSSAESLNKRGNPCGLCGTNHGAGPCSQATKSSRPLDFGELWDRVNPKRVSRAYLRDLIHDAEIEAGEEDGDCRLPLGSYHEGVLACLRELEASRG